MESSNATSTVPQSIQKGKIFFKNDKGEITREVEWGIPHPPDYIFRYRKNRVDPAEQVWSVGGTVSYVPLDAKYIEGKGNFVYWLDVPFPSKTHVPVVAIHAMAAPKRLTMNALRFLASLHKKGRFDRLIGYYNDICWQTMCPFFLKDEYYCSVAKEVRKVVRSFVMSIGVSEENADRFSEVIGYFFEYDNAYRWRLQDLAGETTLEALLDNLPKELNRLIGILESRETVEIGGKIDLTLRFKNAIVPLVWAWRIPALRKRLKNALKELDLQSMRMDEADIYHSNNYADYNFKGKTIDERMKDTENIHGGKDKLPLQIRIQNSLNG